MVLRETLPEPETWEVAIYATDISRRAFEQAKRAVYNPNSVRVVPQDYLAKYFLRKSGMYAIPEKIKGMVYFSDHNLVTDAYDRAMMLNLDIIFCRNVTIYFNLDMTKKVIDNFSRKLVNGGYLFLGHSETLWKISEKFEPIEISNTFLYRKGDPMMPAVEKPFIPSSDDAFEVGIVHEVLPAKPKVEIRKDAAEPQSLYSEAVLAAQSKRYDEALSLLSRIKEEDRHFIQAQIARAGIFANQGKHDEAVSLLNLVLNRDNLCEEAYYLLGILYNRAGDYKKASEMLEKSLYVNSENPAASFHLAEIHLRLNHPTQARRSYRNTLKLLDALPPDQVIPFSEDMTPELLSRTCLKQLEILDRS